MTHNICSMTLQKEFTRGSYNGTALTLAGQGDAIVCNASVSARSAHFCTLLSRNCCCRIRCLQTLARHCSQQPSLAEALCAHVADACQTPALLLLRSCVYTYFVNLCLSLVVMRGSASLSEDTAPTDTFISEYRRRTRADKVPRLRTYATIPINSV